MLLLPPLLLRVGELEDNGGAVTLAEPEALGVPRGGVGVAEAVAARGGEAEAEPVPEGGADPVARAEAVARIPVGELESEDASEAEGMSVVAGLWEEQALSVRSAVALPEAEPEPPPVLEGEPLAVAAGAEGVAMGDGVAAAVAEDDRVGNKLAVGCAGEPEGGMLPLALALVDPDGVSVGLSVGVAVPVTVGCALGEALAQMLAEGDAELQAERLGAEDTEPCEVALAP